MCWLIFTTITTEWIFVQALNTGSIFFLFFEIINILNWIF